MADRPDDYYATVIRERTAAGAADLLADRCRKGDAEIAHLTKGNYLLVEALRTASHQRATLQRQEASRRHATHQLDVAHARLRRRYLTKCRDVEALKALLTGESLHEWQRLRALASAVAAAAENVRIVKNADGAIDGAQIPTFEWGAVLVALRIADGSQPWSAKAAPEVAAPSRLP